MNVQLDDATFAIAQELAAARHCTVEELVRILISKEQDPASGARDLVGFLADEPELVDKILEDVYRTRETQSLRMSTNGSGDP